MIELVAKLPCKYCNRDIELKIENGEFVHIKGSREFRSFVCAACFPIHKSEYETAPVQTNSTAANVTEGQTNLFGAGGRA